MPKLDRSVVGGALPLAVCIVFGILFATWSAALDALSGRILLSSCAKWSVVLVLWAVGLFASDRLGTKMRRPAKLLPLLFFVCAFLVFILLTEAGGIEKSWLSLLADFHRTSGTFEAFLWTTALFFFAPLSFFAGMIMRQSSLAIMNPGERGKASSAFLVVLIGVFPFWVASGVAAGPLLSSFGIATLSRISLLSLGICSAIAALVFIRGKAKAISCALFLLLTLGMCAVVRTKSGAEYLLSAGVFPHLVHRDSGFAKGKPILEKRTWRHTVSLYDDPDYGFVFCQDGRPKIFASHYSPERTLAGCIPMLLNPGAKSAAVVGPDAGYVIPYLARAGVPRIDYAGADKRVVRMAVAADDCIVRGNLPLENSPAWKAMHNGLRLGGNYDIICIEPEPVWMRGTWRSFGAGLFKKCRSAMAENGLVSLHLDARALSTRRFAAIARAFTGVFPDVQVWNIGMYDWLLVGAKLPFHVSASKAIELMEAPEVSKDLLRIGIVALPDLIPSRLCSGEDIEPWLGRVVDESALRSGFRLPSLAFGEDDFALRPNQLENCRKRSIAWLAPDGLEPDVYTAVKEAAERNIDARTLTVLALSALGRSATDPGLRAAGDAFRINPRDLLLRQFAAGLEMEGQRRMDMGDFDGARKCYQNLLRFDASGAIANFGMGCSLRALNKNKEAFDHFVRAVVASPKNTGFRMELAQMAGALGDYERAEMQYEEILKLEPKNAKALFRYAKSLASKDRPEQHFDKAIRLAEQACVITRWKNREYAYGLADIYLDAGRTTEGFGLKRRLKEAYGN